jgi:hypothetical protein
MPLSPVIRSPGQGSSDRPRPAPQEGSSALAMFAVLVAGVGLVAVIAAGFALSFDAIRTVGRAAEIRDDLAWLQRSARLAGRGGAGQAELVAPVRASSPLRCLHARPANGLLRSSSTYRLKHSNRH